MREQKIIRRKHRFVNGTKGVISLFMAMLLVPATILTGSLVSAARINSAVAIFDEALCNASNSTLGTYDTFLRQRFGLLAMSQDISGKSDTLNQYTVSDLISETFSYYMEQNLGILSNTYITSETSSTGVYPLADQDILLSQVLEYSKYSVPTKLVSDGLEIEDLINSLVKSLPGAGYFSLITAGINTADSMVTLGIEFENLKTSITEQVNADSGYVNAYNTFSSKVSSYIDTKAEMEIKIPELESKVSTLETELAYLKASAGEEEMTDDITQKETELQDAKTELQTTKTSYENKLDTLKTEVSSSKMAYSQAITALSDKLGGAKNALVGVQEAILSVGNSLVSTATEAAGVAVNDTKKENTDKIKELEEKKSKETDENKIKEIQTQIDDLNKKNVDISNQGEIIKANGKGAKAAIDSAKTSISEFDPIIYNTIIEKLTTVKTNVDAYDATTISTKVSEPTYYCTVGDILTLETVLAAEANIVSECVKASAWAVIKQVIAFIEALFKISVIYDPNLAAVIDTDYYKNTYNGLPADKDRVANPLNYGEDGDAELSEQYKQLLGFYDADGIYETEDIDVIAIVGDIITNLGIISAGITSMMSLVGVLFLGQTLKNIMNACESIINDMKLVISSFSNIAKTVGNKVLLSGYINYMTSNRTTYSGEALTGAKFNLRGQEGSESEEAKLIGGFSELIALVTSVGKMATGGTEKCFVGAETEYILFGSASEIVNQTAMFVNIFIIRALLNIPSVMTNPEVQSIAACFTVGAPVVWLVYCLVEGLADSVIIVNGGDVPLVKNLVYLTPSGLNALMSKFTKLKLSSEQMDSVKIGFLDAIGASDYADPQAAFGTSADTKEKDLLNMDYSKMLFVMTTLGTSRANMVRRLSNIVQMEAVENIINKTGKDDAMFDLDYSYTYIRTEGNFTTNEFIKMSETGLLTAKKRIVYRGY